VLRDDQCIISTGLIDSLSVLKLIVALETKLQVQIPKEKVQPEDFDSVEIILDTIGRIGL
jgi:acyl carrier protein